MTPATPAARSEESILARIVASIAIPGEELGVTPPPRPAPTPAAVQPPVAPKPALQQVAAAKAKAARDEADRTAAARTIAQRETAAAREAKSSPRKGKKPEADEKAAAARKGAKKEPADPQRIWVQVAGGANESDLPKAWAAAQRKAAALKGREAYSTPLRATNRVLTGPFKTEAEARAFINQLARQGVSAFSFTSEAGQKLTKLPAR